MGVRRLEAVGQRVRNASRHAKVVRDEECVTRYVVRWMIGVDSLYIPSNSGNKALQTLALDFASIATTTVLTTLGLNVALVAVPCVATTCPTVFQIRSKCLSVASLCFARLTRSNVNPK